MNNNLPILNKDYEKFKKILYLYEQEVSDPNADIRVLFGLENHLKFFCTKYNLDFIQIRDDILKYKTFNYTKYISNPN